MKLNRVLAFSDFQAYAVQGQAITGLEYQQLDHGPALRRYLPLQQTLIGAGDAQLVPVAKGRYVQRRLVAART